MGVFMAVLLLPGVFSDNTIATETYVLFGHSFLVLFVNYRLMKRWEKITAAERDHGLKKINDTLGHKAGDEYIRTSCELLCVHYKYSPVYRIGGDEFVVLLQGRDYDARDELLAEINAEIEQNIGLGKAVLSLGQAIYDPAADSSFYDVFKRADGLMYERKMQLKSIGAVTRD